MKFAEFVHTLGSRFIIGGDFNAKHIHLESRLIATKSRALLKVANNINAEINFTRKPINLNKFPDMLDIFVVKGIF